MPSNSLNQSGKFRQQFFHVIDCINNGMAGKRAGVQSCREIARETWANQRRNAAGWKL
jgi:hypothetical protein